MLVESDLFARIVVVLMSFVVVVFNGFFQD